MYRHRCRMVKQWRKMKISHPLLSTSYTFLHCLFAFTCTVRSRSDACHCSRTRVMPILYRKAFFILDITATPWRALVKHMGYARDMKSGTLAPGFNVSSNTGMCLCGWLCYLDTSQSQSSRIFAQIRVSSRVGFRTFIANAPERDSTSGDRTFYEPRRALPQWE